MMLTIDPRTQAKARSEVDRLLAHINASIDQTQNLTSIANGQEGYQAIISYLQEEIISAAQALGRDDIIVISDGWLQNHSTRQKLRLNCNTAQYIFGAPEQLRNLTIEDLSASFEDAQHAIEQHIRCLEDLKRQLARRTYPS